MSNVKVVTAYVPIPVKHLNREQYMDYANRLVRTCDGKIAFFEDDKFEDLWLRKVRPHILDVPPAAPVPEDRYPDAKTNVMSHVIQHNRTTWSRRAVEEDPTIDVVIWLDLAIMKQGDFTGKKVTEDHVWDFVQRVGEYYDAGHTDIPFPGIEERKPINVHGNNWRFCGSTHIWPVRYLNAIDMCYKTELLRFLYHEKCVPLDLAIWPLVEYRSLLPFKWYKAEYDYTQLTEFPK